MFSRLLTTSLRASAPRPTALLRLTLLTPAARPSTTTLCASLRAYSDAAPVEDAAQKLKGELKAALKTAMKARDAGKTGIVKSLLADVTYFEKSFSPPIEASAEQVVKVIQKSIGRRKESADQYRAADRTDLAEKEEQEAEFISTFLPAFMPLEKISPILARLAEELKLEPGAGSMKALGGLLGAFYKEVGRTAADTKVVTQAAKELLGLK